MYCPACRAEYREGFTECSDCRVALIANLPLPTEQLDPLWDPVLDQGPPTPDLETVEVLESGDPVAVALARGSLEDAGIPFYIAGDEISVREAPLPRGWCRIQVAREHEAEARRLLEPLIEPDAGA